MSDSPTGHSWWKRYAVGGALLAAGVAGGGALGNTMVASADTVTGAASTVAGTTTSAAGTATSDTTTTDSDTTDSTSTADESRPQRADEVLLTGSEADRVTAAALAAYPGATVDRVETDSGGVFEAHLTTTDGQQLIVQVGADFTVTGTETHGDR